MAKKRHTSRRSPPVTFEMAVAILIMIKKGMMQHDIAACFGINQGRVSEVVNGRLHPLARIYLETMYI